MTFVELLEAWLPRQRWFAGKGRDFRVRGTRGLGVINDEPHCQLWLITVGYGEGDTETYQVPLVYRLWPAEHLRHALLGEHDDPDDHLHTWVYDAAHDKEATGAWLRHIAKGDTIGTIAFHREPGSPEFPMDEPSIVMGAEQSNTSMVFGDVAILKLFRRVSHGVNPDIEVHSALAAAESPHIATPLGWVGARWPDEQGVEREGSLAMLQVFLRTAAEGWELAKASVRDLFAEGDLHADEVGGDFAGEAHRLGIATAEVHADLARTLPTSKLGRSELSALARDMRARLEAAAAGVPALAPYADRLQAAYDDLAAQRRPVPVQRIHGDYHLGQVLRTVTGWVLLDFEGEPAKPIEERRRLDSPLRDVAGMLRSLDYAARYSLADRVHDTQLGYRAAEWAERNRGAFCDGYAHGSGTDPRDQGVLLRAYEIDKAVYEVVYEARNRPRWLPIPMSAIERLAGPA